MTSGDNYNCKCPYCGKNLHYIGVDVEKGRIRIVKRTCLHCKKEYQIKARLEITVQAFTMEELK